MKKISKIVSLSMAAIMLVSMPVMAAESPSRGGGSSSGGGSKEISAEERAERAAAAKEAALTQAFAREAQADAAAAEASGIPMATTVAATSEKKTVGEYANNAVTELPGLSDVTPISQGGSVIINGAPSNQTFSVLKPSDNAISVAKTYASNIGGTVLNVVEVNASVKFDTATVNFYMPGVTSANNIKVVQWSNGQWTDVSVAEVRTDHVVINMTSLGTLAFVEVPAQ